ncbi:MAG: helix-turn-helix domain-containing protein [Candidatus Micrarchaeia archaeon]
MDILLKLGFSSGEDKVYSAILNSDHATLQRIHEQTGFERRNVYDIINKLIGKGLVSYFTENGHKVYRVTSPKNILSVLEDEERRIAEKKNLLKIQEQQLLRLYESSKPDFDVRIYRGREGLRSLFNEMLEHRDVHFIGGNWGMVKYLGKEWVDRWMAKRVSRKITMHDIITASAKFFAQYPQPKEFYEFRVLPPEMGSPNVICMFGNRVVNIFWGENLFAFQIENPEIAKSYFDYFAYLWKTLDSIVKVYYGFEGVVAVHEHTYDKLGRGDEYVSFGIPPAQPKSFHSYWQKDHERRAKAGIRCRLLFHPETPDSVLKNRNSYAGCEARRMPLGVRSPAWIQTYKDVTYISIVSASNPVTIEITNQDIANSFRTYFEGFWAKSKRFK